MSSGSTKVTVLQSHSPHYKSLRVRCIRVYAPVRPYFYIRRAQNYSKYMSFGLPGLSLYIIYEQASCFLGQHLEIY